MSQESELSGIREQEAQTVGLDLYDRLHALVINRPTDFEPYGFRTRDGDDAWDCSSGCKWFIPLKGKLETDWGVCANALSPRSGLLTFEHQGCLQFEAGENVEVGTEMWPMQR